MKRNLGAFDKVFRIAIAALIAVLFFTHVLTGAWAAILMIIAGIFFVTGLVSVCPLYSLLGISTRSEKNSKKIA